MTLMGGHEGALEIASYLVDRTEALEVNLGYGVNHIPQELV